MRFRPPVKARQSTFGHVFKKRILRTVVPAALAVAVVSSTSSPAQSVLGLLPQWPASTTTVGTTQTVTGDLLTAVLGDIVVLQQKVPGGWRTVSRDSVDTGGGYALNVPTWWLGTREYRLKTPLGALSLPWTAKVVPAYQPAGLARQHKYQVTTQTARWNPCEPIGWRLTNASPGALKDARGAFRRLGQATGFTFVYRGTSARVPQFDANSWYPADTQIVVAWARRSQSSLFSAYPSADAVGAAYYSDGYRNGDGTPAKKITKGMVVIDSSKRFPAGFGVGATRGEVLLHELGHTMGLSHVESSSQRMYPYWTSGVARFGRGDLAGLENRGAKLGCLASATGRDSLRGNPGQLIVND